MNPVFVALVLIAGTLLWLLLSWLYPIIGSVSKRIWEDAKYNMQKDDKKENIKDDN